MSSDRRSCSDDVPQDVQAAILLKDFTQPIENLVQIDVD